MQAIQSLRTVPARKATAARNAKQLGHRSRPKILQNPKPERKRIGTDMFMEGECAW